MAFFFKGFRSTLKIFIETTKIFIEKIMKKIIQKLPKLLPAGF